MESSSGEESRSGESDSDSEVLHDLCNKVNFGLANASSTVGNESYKSSLSATTTDCSTDIQTNENVADASLLCTTLESDMPIIDSNKTPLKSQSKIQREPILQRKDSLDKVIKIIDSRTFVKSEPSTSQRSESLPKDKLILNAETLLILNLLGMSSEARQQYLIEMAKQRKLLLTNPKTNTFNVNPDLFDVNNVPQVVDFVHQFHGKPIPAVDTTVTSNLNPFSRKLKTKLRTTEKKQEKAAGQDNKTLNKIIMASGINVQMNLSERHKMFPKESSSMNPPWALSEPQLLKKSNKIASSETAKRSNSLIVSAQSASTSHLNVLDRPNKKSRTFSASEAMTVPQMIRRVDKANAQQDIGEKLSKRQEKKLRKQLRSMCIQATAQANAEKPPRKRGRRGSKKVADETILQNQPHQQSMVLAKSVLSTTIKSQTDVAAKNLIRNKCSQINVKIQEKLNLCSSSIKPGSSSHQSDDLVVESIEHVEKSDDENDESSSVTSDSSNFPNDEDTTSYWARSDDMESSCNEKRVTKTNACGPIEQNVLKDDVTTRCEVSGINTQDAAAPAPNEKSSKKCRTNASVPMHVSNECVMIMKLLTAKDETARNTLLQKAAVDANIFLKHQDKTILNSRLVRMKNVFTSPAILKCIEDNTTKQRREKETFESEVNRLVRRYVAEADTYKYVLSELVLHNGRYAFDDQENRKTIDSFVESLIAANFGRVIEGDIRVNEYDNTEAYMTNEDHERDVYFSSMLIRQCAFHCTRVKAFVFTVDDRTPCVSQSVAKKIVRGFVTHLLDDQTAKQIIGKFDLSNSTATSSFVIIPGDRRLPRIKIDKNWDPKILSNTLVPKEKTLYLVKLNYWKDKKAYGTVVEEIGLAGEIETGNRAILLKNCLNPVVFAESIKAALPKEPFVIPESEYTSRENLTKDCIFTIDPLTARDLDDAVSCKILENGNYEIGVHISDVSYFVTENSELDNVVQDQATTIYLVNTVYHMLPRELCMLCSLLPGQDKLTFSVFWEMTPKAEIISTRFAKTIINSCTQLAYEHAQLMINQPDKEFEEKELPKIHRFTHRDLSKIINTLNSIAIILRKGRYEKGCISINQQKITFDLNDNGDPIAFRPDQRNESNFLIEEFMLLANQSVAKFIYEKFPDIAVLRNHAPPKANMMEELVVKLSSLNYKMDISSSKAIANSTAAIIRASGNNDAVSTVLNSMIAKPMVRAEYFCSARIKNAKSLFHFALSIPIYTHFTSPIRRYPDILVHRLLAAGLNLAPIPTRTPEELKSITRNCNDQKYNAKLAGEDSTNLYFLHYLRLFGPIKMRAAVKEVSKGADLHVMLIDSGHNVRVNIKQNVPELKFILENGVPSLQFVGSKNSSPIRVNIFDVVLVEVFAKDEILKAKLLPPE